MNNDQKKCKFCQTEMDKKAKICLRCGRKQGGKLKYIIIAFIAIVIIANVINQSDTSDSKTASSNKAETNEAKNDAKKDDTEKEINDSKDQPVALGAEGESEDLLLKVNESGESQEIVENEYFSYTPDSGKYAIVNITIKNTGKDSASITSGYFQLVTADGTKYNPTILVGLSNEYINFESINPGLDKTGNLVFEVPSDLVVADATLNFSGTGLFTKATIFNLK